MKAVSAKLIFTLRNDLFKKNFKAINEKKNVKFQRIKLILLKIKIRCLHTSRHQQSQVRPPESELN